jgi:hypothetical protein
MMRTLTDFKEREQELDEVAAKLRPAVEDYLHGDQGEEINLEAIKAAGRKRLADTRAS